MADIDRALLLGVLGALIVFGVKVSVAVILTILLLRGFGVSI